MNKHKMSKKLLATIMTFAMLITMFPSGVFAQDSGSKFENGEIVSGTVTNTENGVTVNKYVTGNAQDGYELTLEGYASNQLTTTSTSTPLDIVLVLDVSGSMDDPFGDEYWQDGKYVRVHDEKWTADKLDRGTYYYLDGSKYREVYVDNEGGLGVFRDPKYVLKFEDNDRQVPGSLTSSERNGKLYEGDLYYYQDGHWVEPSSALEALQAAANEFIDSVNMKNQAIPDENNKHRISIVKFADNSYANKIGDNKGTNSTQVVKDFTYDADSLSTAINALHADGATAADYGLNLASIVLNGGKVNPNPWAHDVDSVQGARENAKKIIVFFTDGDPNHQNGFDGTVANSTIETAKKLKKNTTIYTVGIFDDANPDGNSDSNKYMNGVSSNYPDASSYKNLGDRVSDDKDYYFAADDAESLTNVFEGIAEDVTTGDLEVNPDKDATLEDTLSQYFDLPAGITEDQVEVKYFKATGYDPEKGFSFANEASEMPEGTDIHVDIDEKNENIKVSGFDYKANAASYEKQDDGRYDVSGGKLVVTFEIEVDENACLLKPVENGQYPTNDTDNSRAKLTYKESDKPHAKTTATVLNESPKVYYDNTTFDANGTDVTVQVYLDGNKVENPLDYVSIGRDQQDTEKDYFKLVKNDKGVLTYDFNYEDGGYDMVDLKVTLGDKDTYLLQGVNSYQSFGSKGTDNVRTTDAANGIYVVDNVTSDKDSGVDCTIYLNTKYSIEYYQVDEDGDSTEIGNDSNVYIAPEKVTTTDDNDKIKDGESDWMNWKNTGYQPSATLAQLPSDGVIADGWYLGSVTNTGMVYEGQSTFDAFNASSDTAGKDAADRIIKFFATTADATSHPVVDKSVYSIAGDTDNTTEANVGDTIVYAIKIKNEGNIATTMTLSDSMSNDQAITTFYTKAECTDDDVVTDEDLKFNADQEKTFYAKYEVKTGDKGATLTNTITVTDSDKEQDDDPSEDVKVAELYDLVYDANGGKYVDNAEVDGVTFSNDHKTATESDLQKGDHDLNTEIAEELATRQTSDGIDVIFVGWTENEAVKDKVYDKDAEKVPAKTDNVTIDSEGERVYAIWAEDANGNDVPDYQEDQYTLTYNANGGSLTENLDEKVEDASVDGLLPNTEAKPNYPLWDKEGDAYTGTIPSEVKDQWPSHEQKDGEDVIFIGWTAEADTTIYSKNDKDDFAKVTLLDNVVLNEETMDDNTEKIVYAVWGYDEDGDGIPDVQEDQYSLTYHSTSGYFGDKDTITAAVTGLLEDKDYELWAKDEEGKEIGTKPDATWPKHDQAPAPEDSVIADEGTNVNVAFIGWTETDYTASYEDGLNHIFAAGEAYPEVKTTTHIPPNDSDMNRDVYAVWGYDENGDGIADAQQIVITPADITIYEGGNGYEGVVENGENSTVAGENGEANGLPEPGYYLILPAALDEQLGGEGNTEDLSNQLRLEYDFEGDHRAWTLDLYNVNEGVTAAENRVPVDRNHDGDTSDENDFYYVYQLKPASDNPYPVRLEFKVDTSDGADYITDDEIIDFGLNNLFEKYSMRLYNTEDFNRGAVVAQIDPDGDGEWTDVSKDIARGIARGFGTLTIRGTNIEEPVANVAGTTEALDFEENNKVAAQLTDDDTTYFVNGSKVPVINQDAVSFLADNITEESETASVLKDVAVEKAASDESLGFDSSYTFDFSYLDLVDTSNGNAYVTTDKPVSVYWQYPDKMDENDEFYVVHYEGLDREFDAADLNSMLTDENVKVYSVDAAEDSGLQLERTENGIKITTTSFSPFALVYKQKDNEPAPNPGPGGSGDDERPGLNLEDHYSYIVGYPEDYRTGEATDDESLWPVKPQGKITRAEVATIFYRLLNDETRTENWTTDNDFTDVSEDNWFNTPVSTLSNMGIIVGYNDGSFQPNAPITRAEFAAIAVRFYQNNDVNYEEGLFTDIEGSEWFADAIAAAYEHGIIGGYVDGSFQPMNQITRAEAAAIVNRTTDRFPDKDHLLDEAEMRTWPDNANPDAWYYADIQEATNSHEYYKMDDPDGEEGDQIEQWTERGEDVDWDAVEAYQESVH